MWRLFEFLVLGIIGLLAVTEFFIPLILNKPFFGSFRKAKPAVVKEPTNHVDLKTKVEAAKTKVAEVKKVQGEVTDFFKDAEQLKNEGDDLLK